jgi:hypothetical protein
MTNIKPPKVAQIQAILSESLIGYDNWVEKNLPGFSRKTVQFDQVFDITEQEVFDHVMSHGWDERIVRYVDKLPDPTDPSSMYYKYMILPPSDGRYHVAHFGSFDRQLWLKWDFDNQESMRRWLIAELFKTQQSLWKSS